MTTALLCVCLMSVEVKRELEDLKHPRDSYVCQCRGKYTKTDLTQMKNILMISRNRVMKGVLDNFI